MDRTTRLRWRRRFKRSQYHAQEKSELAGEHVEKHLVKRFTKLPNVRRFLIGWVSLVCLLIIGLVIQLLGLNNYYKVNVPGRGGIFIEGSLGNFTNANPLYISGPADAAVSRLVFSGLLKYDQKNKLVGDLAKEWSYDQRETTYTVKLRPNLFWHDGQPLTAEDVVYTYAVIQDPESKSPLRASWEGISVKALDRNTVQFVLPSALSAFPYSLTNGIVPKHLLGKTPRAQLRSVNFNFESPVGSGPFKWNGIEQGQADLVENRQQTIGLMANPNYHLGRPRLSQIVIKTYHSQQALTAAFADKSIQAMAGLEQVPAEFAGDKTVSAYNIPLTSASMVFFKTSHEFLNDANLRKALVLAADPRTIIADLGYPAVVVNSPLLKSHVGYDPTKTQKTHDLEAANALLDQLGWVKDPATGLRSKNGKPLKLSLQTQNTGEYTRVAQALQKQWREAGIDVTTDLLNDNDLQASITLHNYEMLLYGISLGADPDVYAYWHSSQAAPTAAARLNLSEYSSEPVDAALEGGRSRSEPTLRTIKYRPLLDRWTADNPALALYQTNFLYVVREPLYNFTPSVINQGADRFSNVHEWAIKQEKAIK